MSSDLSSEGSAKEEAGITDIRERGFEGRTYLVCRLCGTQHSVERPTMEPGRPSRPLVLASYGAPMGNVKTIGVQPGSITMHHGAWLNPTPIDGMTPGKFVCQHCGGADCLVSGWREEDLCPGCHRERPKPRYSWVT